MSLISDALKEAQRERSERSGATPRSTASIADEFFPRPPSRKSQTRIPIVAVGVGAVVVALISGTVVFTLIRSRQARATTTVASSVSPRIPSARTLTTSDSSTAPSPIAPAAVLPGTTPPSATPPSTTPAATERSPAVTTQPFSIVNPSSVAAPPPRTAPSAPRSQPPAHQVAAPSSSKAIVAAPSEDRPSRAAQAAISPAATPAQSAAAATPAAAATAATGASGVRVVLAPTISRPSDSLFSRAFAEQSRGNYDRAAELYEKALQIKPVSPQLYNDYGALLAAQGNHTAAIAMYNLGLKSDESDPRLWINLGDSYKSIGRHADAMSTYAEAAKLDPTNAGLKVRLAAEYLAIGDTANARRGYEDAARTAPRDPAIHHAFGVFLQSQRDYRGAAREFQLFVDFAPGKFPAATIDGVKAHIARLGKLAS